MAYGLESQIDLSACLSAIKAGQSVSYIASPSELPVICKAIDQCHHVMPYVNITWANFTQMTAHHQDALIIPLCSLSHMPSVPQGEMSIYYAFGTHTGRIIGRQLRQMGYPGSHIIEFDDGTCLTVDHLADGKLTTKWPVWVTVPALHITQRSDVQGLLDIVAKLRSPDGCPWDREQDHLTLRPCMTEEAVEVIDAINEGSHESLVEELGDVLLQVVMHAQLLSETTEYDINDVVRTICEKLVRRHPHVFGSLELVDSQAVLINWDAIKSKEKADNETNGSILKKSKMSLPALAYAQDVSKRVAREGFEWQEFQGVLDKLEEEIQELLDAKRRNVTDDIENEVGDVLFTVVNLARHLGVDSEQALRKMVGRFRKRFEAMEIMARNDQRELRSLNAEEWDALWRSAKMCLEST